MHADDDQPVLEALGLSRSFPGVRALDGVSLSVRPGEVHAIVGENGAGKSTLIRILSGAIAPDGGTMTLGGRAYAPRSPRQGEALGVACVHQEAALIPHLSVADNLALGREPTRWGWVRHRESRRLATVALSRLGVALDVCREVASLSVAARQLVAIARAIGASARALILDEPTASLDPGETGRLFEVLRRLRDAGLGIVFVSHFLDQVFALADRVTVLRDGRVAGCRSISGVTRAELVGLMLGRALEQRERSVEGSGTMAAPPGSPLLSAHGLGRRGSVEPFDLDVSPGETVGLAGLLGSGRTEAARLLFGLDRADRGFVRIDGCRVSLRGPRDAIARGVAMTPEDRAAEGLVADLSVRENIVLAMQATRGVWRRVPPAAQRRVADELIRALGIRCASVEQPVRTLSGGNQQKVILARWLALRPRVLILDEPTRGVDVGARDQIESLIDRLRDGGLGVLLITAELDHLVRAASRVVVMRDRRVVGRMGGPGLTEAAVVRAIAGGDP